MINTRQLFTYYYELLLYIGQIKKTKQHQRKQCRRKQMDWIKGIFFRTISNRFRQNGGKSQQSMRKVKSYTLRLPIFTRKIIGTPLAGKCNCWWPHAFILGYINGMKIVLLVILRIFFANPKHKRTWHLAEVMQSFVNCHPE